MTSTISIAGLDKAAALAAAYNASQPLGMGFLNPRSGMQMTAEQAAGLLAATEDAYFDYVQGRVMKLDLSSDEVNPWGYDRDNGDGHFARVIASVRQAAAGIAS